MSSLGWHCTCLDCGGPIRAVNHGHSIWHRAIAIVACIDCGAEWSIRTDMARVRGGRQIGRPKQSPEVVAQLAARARDLVLGGHSISHACRTVGIDRHSYYARQGR